MRFLAVSRFRLYRPLVGGLVFVLGVLGVQAARADAVLPQQGGQVDLLTEANLRIDGAAGSDWLGRSVAAAGDVNGDGRGDVIVGAYGADNNGLTDSGSAYVIFGRETPTDIDMAALGAAGFRIDGATAGDTLGHPVAGAGDVNGDGRDDVIVGEYLADTNGRPDSGSAYVIFGRTATTPIDTAALGTAGFRIDGAANGDQLGISVAGAGDVNGDGRDDVIVGAIGAGGNGRTESGSAYVIFGRETPTDIDVAALGAAGFRIDGAAAGDRLGISVAGAGDVNGDGRHDVIVGASTADNNGRTESGSAYVIFGRETPVDIDTAALGAAGFRIDGAATHWLGLAVAGAGDVNGDGRGDVIVSAVLAGNNARSLSGSAYVIFGRTATTSIDTATLGAAGFRIDGAAPDDLLGYSVAGAGDVNGDGRADVIVGAPDAHDVGRPTSGAAYVIFGRTATTSIDTAALGAAGFRIDGAATGDALGFSVAGAGDVNGDGRADVIVGAYRAGNNGRSGSGSAYVVLGFGTPALGYPDPIVATVGRAQAPVVPQVARTGPATFTVAPALPAGLDLDAGTGAISGTPGAVGDTTHVVTMTDLVGTAQTRVRIAIGTPAAPGPGTPPGGGSGADPAALAPAPRCAAVPQRRRSKPSGGFQLSAGQLVINQRISQAAVRRANAVQAWLDAGLLARDLCGGSIGVAEFPPAFGFAAAATPADPPVADPRPVTPARPGPRGNAARVTLSAAQLLINQRISQAAVRRTNALAARLEAGLTGGDIRDGQITHGHLAPRLLITRAPAGLPVPASRTVIQRRRGTSGQVTLTVGQLRINQRIAQAAVRRANTLTDRLKAGLPGTNLRDHTIGVADLAGSLHP